MKKSILKKLKNNKGESITEVLVALLISVISMTLLAGMIAASASMTEKSKKKIDDYYKAENSLEVEAETELGTVNFYDADSETVKISSDDIEVKISKTNDESILAYSVK